MKRLFIISAIAGTVLVFTNCNSGKKAAGKTGNTMKEEKAVVVIPKSTFAGNLSTVIMENCSPCHIPAKGGRKTSYDSYDNVKKDIDDMIRRIELNPTDRGFMPFRGAAKLADSTIAKFKKWRDDGLLDK